MNQTAEDIPALVLAAGDAAATAYSEFLDDPTRSAATGKIYRVRAVQFFRWAASRGLSLETIDAPALAAYATDIAAARKSQHVATVHLTPVRGMLGHMARLGVLAADPCPKAQPNGRTTASSDAGPAPSIPLLELKQLVLKAGEADGWVEDSEDFRAGLVMLAPLSIGTMDPAAVAAFTRLREPPVRVFADRLLANGIWRPDGILAASWDNDLEFMMDVWVATGELQRHPGEEGDESPGYALRETAEDPATRTQEALHE
jgi:hypothetical protein